MSLLPVRPLAWIGLFTRRLTIMEGGFSTPEHERYCAGDHGPEVDHAFGESIPTTNVTRRSCIVPRNGSLETAR
jgi:hypothetical protein